MLYGSAVVVLHSLASKIYSQEGYHEQLYRRVGVADSVSEASSSKRKTSCSSRGRVVTNRRMVEPASSSNPAPAQSLLNSTCEDACTGRDCAGLHQEEETSRKIVASKASISITRAGEGMVLASDSDALLRQLALNLLGPRFAFGLHELELAGAVAVLLAGICVVILGFGM